MTLTLSKDKNIIELARIMQVVEKTQEELNNVVDLVNGIDVKRLSEIIRICKSGLSFTHIYSEKTTYSCSGTNYRSDDIEYQSDDAKGFIVADYYEYENKHSQGRNYTKLDLYLLPDLSFREYRTKANQSYWQDSSDTYTKEYVGTLTIEEVVEGWDVDEIVSSIKNGLEKRLENLGTRTKSQTKRLESLQKLTV